MLRAMRGTFLFAFDPAEAMDNDDRSDDNPTPGEIKRFLDEAVKIDVDTEENGNPIGFASAELDFDSMVELTPDEVDTLYHDGKRAKQVKNLLDLLAVALESGAIDPSKNDDDDQADVKSRLRTLIGEID